MIKKRTVAVFTGSRAEYGLEFPILKAIAAHSGLEYKLIVSGAHLDPHFGRTLEEIKRDGFRVHAEVKMEVIADTLFSTANAIGTGIVSMSKILDSIRPDILLVYGDRFEAFAALVAGTQMSFPTAHVEGGDITEGGALDDSVRHAMTKLAHLHFTTNEQARERILRMGEEAWRVHNVGFPAIDLISEGLFASPASIMEKYGLRPDKPVVLFTQHSIATQFQEAAAQVRPSLKAIERLAHKGVQALVTYPNYDAGGRAIIKEIEKLRAKRIPGIFIHKNLGRYNYHGVLNFISKRSGGACAGNSSSGIKESPAFHCPTVNIGSRQDKRLRSDNVIDTGYRTDEISRAVERCINDAKFLKKCGTCRNPYGRGNAGKKIANILAKIRLDQKLIAKKMTF